MGARSNRNLDPVIRPARYGAVETRGDRRAVNRNRTGIGSRPVLIIPREDGHGHGRDDIAGVVFIDGRDGHHGRIGVVGALDGAGVVLAPPVGQLHHVNGVVRGDVQGHGLVLVECPALLEDVREGRAIDGDRGGVGRGDETEGVASAPGGQWHGEEFGAPIGQGPEFLHQVVAGGHSGGHVITLVGPEDPHGFVGRECGAGKIVGNGGVLKLVDVSLVEGDGIRDPIDMASHGHA